MDEWEGIPNIDLAKEIIGVLAQRGVYLTTVRVQKLLYLVERQHVLDTGGRAFFLDYRYDRFGMYSPTLNRLIVQLSPAKDHLRVTDITSERGPGRRIRWVGKGLALSIPEQLGLAVAKVLSRWGFLDSKTLVDAAKLTAPFIYARKGETLDWKMLADERCAEDEKLSEEGSRRLREAEERIAEGKYRVFDSPDDVIEYLFA